MQTRMTFGDYWRGSRPQTQKSKPAPLFTNTSCRTGDIRAEISDMSYPHLPPFLDLLRPLLHPCPGVRSVL